MTNNYRAGVRGEKKTRAWLEGQGYFVVEARGSHGAVDLVGVHINGMVVVQVKTGRKLSRPESAEARAALRSVPVPEENGSRWLVTWPKYAREPEVEVVE